ncbi:MAG: aminomethyl-transferring glycine dehydrogenase subunit GcvPB [Planctomycetota bacterium]|jgi:glycine dehydrogenase subunit 2
MKPHEVPLLFETSSEGRCYPVVPDVDVPEKPIDELLPPECRRKAAPRLPDLAAIDVTRHFIRLSRRNVGVDNVFYPLGSCTMKFNPKATERLAALGGFAFLHPYQDFETAQGMLELLYETERFLCEISGFDAVSLAPAAGAHGEMTSLMVIRAALRKRGENRKTVLIPDSAHGTNPASCTIAGFKTAALKSGPDGLIDTEDLKSKMNEDVGALMVTNPNTLGLFENNICEISRIVHDAGGYVYMDGANLNAILGIARPGDFGIDIMHFNLHKTFSTPHGGGGPGSGPIGVTSELEPYLPVPRPEKGKSGYTLDWKKPKSIGQTRAFAGNIGVIVKSWGYIRMLGAKGLKRVAEHSVLNANYLRSRLGSSYKIAQDRICMHECVFTAPEVGDSKAPAQDIAKRLLDYGFHPPTVYFPLIVPHALMIEPTETESKATLDEFAEILIEIAREAREEPEKLIGAPVNTPVRRLDETGAARNPILRWTPAE